MVILLVVIGLWSVVGDQSHITQKLPIQHLRQTRCCVVVVLLVIVILVVLVMVILVCGVVVGIWQIHTSLRSYPSNIYARPAVVLLVVFLVIVLLVCSC